MRVNIIVPVYNTESFLNKCLDSIFRQTYKDIFVICINDGSSDGSSSILNNYKKQHNNMVVINKKNGGLASARNAGLNVIKDFDNCYIAFIDSDDYISREYIEILVKKAEEFNADIVSSSFFIDKDGNISNAPCVPDEGLVNSFKGVEYLLNGNIQSHCPCKLFKSHLWENTRFDESLFFMEDQAITFKLFLKSNNICITNWAGYFIGMREGSLCQSKMTNKKILCALRSYKIACDYDYNELDDKEKIHLKNLSFNLFGKIFLMMYPRFVKKNSSELELTEWKTFIKFEKKNKIVKKLIPEDKKERIKKIVFIYFHFLYKMLYRMFLKRYER